MKRRESVFIICMRYVIPTWVTEIILFFWPGNHFFFVNGLYRTEMVRLCQADSEHKAKPKCTKRQVTMVILFIRQSDMTASSYGHI